MCREVKERNGTRVYASCLEGNRKKDYMVLMEKAFLCVQDTSTVERQNGI